MNEGSSGNQGFSRRNLRGLVELEDLRDAGVRIVAIGDSIDYPTHDDWTNIRLRFLLNDMPVTDSSQKVKSVISRRQHEQAKRDSYVRACELVWQNGGHFTEIEKRMAQGFSWLIGHADG